MGCPIRMFKYIFSNLTRYAFRVQPTSVPLILVELQKYYLIALHFLSIAFPNSSFRESFPSTPWTVSTPVIYYFPKINQQRKTSYPASPGSPIIQFISCKKKIAFSFTLIYFPVLFLLQEGFHPQTGLCKFQACWITFGGMYKVSSHGL